LNALGIVKKEQCFPQGVHVVSLSGGALLANLVSVALLVAETITIRR